MCDKFSTTPVYIKRRSVGTYGGSSVHLNVICFRSTSLFSCNRVPFSQVSLHHKHRLINNYLKGAQYMRTCRLRNTQPASKKRVTMVIACAILKLTIGLYFTTRLKCDA